MYNTLMSFFFDDTNSIALTKHGFRHNRMMIIAILDLITSFYDKVLYKQVLIDQHYYF